MSKRYKVVLIEEGLGNLSDLFYYTRDALQFAVDNKVFEGKKYFANHPDALEEKIRPERSVRDICGYFENTHIENGPANQAMLCGDLIVLQGPEYDWVNILMESAIDFAGKFDAQLVGLSINAAGDSIKKSLDDVMADDTLPVSVRPKLFQAQIEGATEIEWCTKLVDAVSCDLVTEAGARGRIVKMLESEKNKMSKKTKENEKKLLEEFKKKQAAKIAAKKAKESGGAADLSAGSAGSAPADDGAQVNPDHPDADQDKQLIQAMIQKYLGDGDHPEEVHQAMKQAYEHAKEMGMEGEEAEKCAGYSMKMAKHAAEKKEKESKEAGDAQEDEADADPAPSAPADGADGSKGDPGSAAPSKSVPPKKESEAVKAMQKEIAELKKYKHEQEISNFIKSTVESCGFKGKLEKQFRENVKGAKSLDEIKKTAKIMKETISVSEGESFYFNPEKTGSSESSGFSLAGCVKE